MQEAAAAALSGLTERAGSLPAGSELGSLQQLGAGIAAAHEDLLTGPKLAPPPAPQPGARMHPAGMSAAGLHSA
jgi:hypothetical protein